VRVARGTLLTAELTQDLFERAHRKSGVIEANTLRGESKPSLGSGGVPNSLQFCHFRRLFDEIVADGWHKHVDSWWTGIFHLNAIRGRLLRLNEVLSDRMADQLVQDTATDTGKVYVPAEKKHDCAGGVGTQPVV
jgi:hypothetical protein